MNGQASAYLKDKFIERDEHGFITSDGVTFARDIIAVHNGVVSFGKIYHAHDGQVLPNVYWDAVQFLCDEYDYQVRN